MINLLKDGPLWRSFGITIEKGQGNEWFIFDKERGMSLADNIAVVSQVGDSYVQIWGQVNGKDYNVKVPLPEKHEAVDAFLYDYFFS